MTKTLIRFKLKTCYFTPESWVFLGFYRTFIHLFGKTGFFILFLNNPDENHKFSSIIYDNTLKD